MSRGRFITLEGGEGAGKSTQIRRLAERLATRGIPHIITREPGGAPGAEDIRRLLVEGAADRWDALTEALLHFAARRDHVRRTVEPALAAGQWVLCDRFADSTMAYQGYGHRLGRAPVETLQALVLGDFRPDLTLVFDLPVARGLERALNRPGAETRYESMDIAFHERLREGFLDIAAREPGRCVVIDAGGSLETVGEAAWGAVRDRLGLAP